MKQKRAISAFQSNTSKLNPDPLPRLYLASWRDKTLRVVIGFLILIAAHSMARMVRAYFIARSQRTWNTPDDTRQMAYLMLGNVIYYSIMFLTVLILLHILGFEIASIIAIIGTFGFAIGLAMQGALGDMVSGILLSMNGVYTIGDVIELNGRQGVVREFSLMTTLIEEIDTKAIIVIPNRTIRDGMFINHTKQRTRLMHFDVLVSNRNKDFQHIIDTIARVAMNSPKVLKDHALDINVTGMNSAGTNIKVKLMIQSKDYPWMIAPFMTDVREALAAENVHLLDIQMVK